MRGKPLAPASSAWLGCLIVEIPAALVLALIGATGSAFAAETTTYAGQQTRELKALSEAHIAGLLAGRGMGYAKAAELNGYPGPLHVLELADELALSDQQRSDTQELFNQMQTSAKRLGATLVDAERQLDEVFQAKSVDEKALSDITANIGRIEAQLRAVHLRAHVRHEYNIEHSANRKLHRPSNPATPRPWPSSAPATNAHTGSGMCSPSCGGWGAVPLLSVMA